LAEMLWDSDTQALFASIIAFHFGGRAFGKWTSLTSACTWFATTKVCG
jgi:hypothetical protein